MKKTSKNNFVTEDYLDQKFKEFWERLETYLNFRFEPFEKMRIDFYTFKDRMEKNIDWLIGKYDKFDKELTYYGNDFILGSDILFYSEFTEKVDNWLKNK